VKFDGVHGAVERHSTTESLG